MATSHEPEHTEHVTHTKVGSGHGHRESSIHGDDSRWDRPPTSSEKISHHEATMKRHMEGGGENRHEGRGVVLEDPGKKSGMRDSPVPEGAQRPNEGIRTKAGEVATEDARIGDRFSGVMER
jgi:hypothetical protein